MPKEIIQTNLAPAPIGPYNQAIKANGFIFISGQIPLDPVTGETVTTSIEEETHMVMKNIAAILAEAKISFSHIVKTTILLSDMSLFAKVNEVYGSYFTDNMPPARETFAVKGLPRGVNVEISTTAVVEL
jgi:2-iminobutanoate/2-iminopropanoate deaminase